MTANCLLWQNVGGKGGSPGQEAIKRPWMSQIYVTVIFPSSSSPLCVSREDQGGEAKEEMFPTGSGV